MKKTDKIILSLVLLAAIGLAFLPNKNWHYHQIKPSKLLYKLNVNHYLTTDKVAKDIITNDPLLMLVDVRKPNEYKKFTLPGAINIPFDSLLNQKNIAILNQNIYKVVLFSNGSSLADEAWLLLHRMNFDGTFVMKGGLNQWFATIIRPTKPEEYADKKQWELYNFRKAASMYFGRGAIIQNSDESISPPKTMVIKHKKTQTNVGGCE
jgi:rhodanese-related sulfurtransferase